MAARAPDTSVAAIAPRPALRGDSVGARGTKPTGPAGTRDATGAATTARPHNPAANTTTTTVAAVTTSPALTTRSAGNSAGSTSGADGAAAAVTPSAAPAPYRQHAHIAARATCAPSAVISGPGSTRPRCSAIAGDEAATPSVAAVSAAAALASAPALTEQPRGTATAAATRVYATRTAVASCTVKQAARAPTATVAGSPTVPPDAARAKQPGVSSATAIASAGTGR